MPYRVAVVKWAAHDGIADAICEELIQLGHYPVCFLFDNEIPEKIDVVLSFAPYGRFIQIPRQMATYKSGKRPVFVHWNTENPPDLRVPWSIVNTVGAWKSWLDRLTDSNREWIQSIPQLPLVALFNNRWHKFRYVGEYHYAYRQGWLDLFVESSAIYADLHTRHGLPTICVPWGTINGWYENLNLPRDIDVLWMGTRRTRRRSKLIDCVREQLAKHGIEMYVADNIEKPFIYGQERTQFLNRAKITLNLLPTWYDHAFPYRFHVAAPNRSLVVTESILPHCSLYEEGKHYVAAQVDQIAETILYYLGHEEERIQITENAYQLVTTQMTFGKSIRTILDHVDNVCPLAS